MDVVLTGLENPLLEAALLLVGTRVIDLHGPSQAALSAHPSEQPSAMCLLATGHAAHFVAITLSRMRNHWRARG
jgi:hypothetical protein